MSEIRTDLMLEFEKAYKFLKRTDNNTHLLTISEYMEDYWIMYNRELTKFYQMKKDHGQLYADDAVETYWNFFKLGHLANE